VDYFLLSRRQYAPAALFQRNGPYWGKAGFNPAGYAAWVIGAVVYVIASRMLPTVGGSLLAFVAAGLAYYVLGSLRNRRLGVRSGDAFVPEMTAETR
jgi:cytosine/uracil/thiamine/allantoin permease